MRLQKMELSDEMLGIEHNHSSSLTDSNFILGSEYPSTINKVRETKARPLSKKRHLPISGKFASQKQLQSELHKAVSDTLRNCRNCKVRLVDCWKGRPLPSYLDSSATSLYNDDNVNSSVKKVKKKKKKDNKVCM